MLSFSNQEDPPRSGNGPMRQRNRRLLILLEILAVLALIFVIFWGISHILTSVVIVLIAALIAYGIVPVVELFQKVMPRALAILLAYLLVIVILGAVAYSVVSTAVIQVSIVVNTVTIWLKPGPHGNIPLLDLLLKFGMTQAQIVTLENQLAGGLSNVAGSLTSGIVPLLTGFASGLLNILLTVVISIYLLVDGARAIRWLRKAAPRSRRSQVGLTIDTIQRVVGGYIRGQILLCTIIGFLVGVGLFIIGFPFAILMGVLTFITEFIPVLGTIFAGTVAVVLALTQGGWVMTVKVLVFFVLVHLFEGYFLAPRLVGKAVQLNPAIMLIALTIGSELFGPFGAIFAAPTAGLLQALVTAIWIQYRQTHKEDFLDTEPESSTKQPEELPAKAATSTIPAGKDTTIAE